MRYAGISGFFACEDSARTTLFGKDMRIREATPEDVNALVELNSHVQSIHALALPAIFRNSLSKNEVADTFKKLIGDRNALWLIAEDERPHAYLLAEFQDRPATCFKLAQRICNLSHIAVRPDSRKQGLAKALIAALVLRAKARGYERIDLDVWSFNREAKAVFAKLGFQVFNERMTLK